MRPGREDLFFELLVTTHFKQRYNLLESLNDRQINFLSSILYNLLKSNIILDPGHKGKLVKHASLIRRLASKTTLLSVQRDLYKKHYKLVISIFKPLLPQMKAKF